MVTRFADTLGMPLPERNGSVSWMETSDSYDKGVTAEGVEEFLKTTSLPGIARPSLAATVGGSHSDLPTISGAKRQHSRRKPGEHAHQRDAASDGASARTAPTRTVTADQGARPSGGSGRPDDCSFGLASNFDQAADGR
jgi:hypothetical protein